MLVFLFRLLSRFVLVARLWSQDRQNITWAVIALTSFGMHCITCFCPIENSLSILVVYIHLTICVSSNGTVLLRDITLFYLSEELYLQAFKQVAGKKNQNCKIWAKWHCSCISSRVYLQVKSQIQSNHTNAEVMYSINLFAL